MGSKEAFWGAIIGDFLAGPVGAAIGAAFGATANGNTNTGQGPSGAECSASSIASGSLRGSTSNGVARLKIHVDCSVASHHGLAVGVYGMILAPDGAPGPSRVAVLKWP